MRGILNKDATPSKLSKANHFGTGIYDFRFMDYDVANILKRFPWRDFDSLLLQLFNIASDGYSGATEEDCQILLR